MAFRPICIVVMPYGRKATNLPPGMQPHTVDFDRLWRLALEPLVEELGYEPVRGDQEMRSAVLRERIERLTPRDLLIADLTVPSAGTWYEEGLGHAGKASGRVLIAATWARSAVDAARPLHVPYPLKSGGVTEDQARAIQRALRVPILKSREESSPCSELKSFPLLEPTRSIAFRAYLQELSRFQKQVLDTRSMPDREQQARRVEALDNLIGPPHPRGSGPAPTPAS